MGYKWLGGAAMLPEEMLQAPSAEQIDFLDAITHVSDPDVEGFVDRFYVAQGLHDCDRL